MKQILYFNSREIDAMLVANKALAEAALNAGLISQKTAYEMGINVKEGTQELGKAGTMTVSHIAGGDIKVEINVKDEVIIAMYEIMGKHSGECVNIVMSLVNLISSVKSLFSGMFASFDKVMKQYI